MDTRQQLHDLIDRLPDSEIAAVHRVLAGFLADKLWVASVTAPEDDEPYTSEQQTCDAEAQSAIDRGEGVSHEAILSEFGVK